jgi:hypothetical protein
VSGIKHFRSRLEGRPFQLWTDHKPATGSQFLPATGSHRRPLAASSATWHSFLNTPTSLCMYQVRLTWWRTHCPARRPPPPGPPGSAQPSPTGLPWISRTWPSARTSAHRYKHQVPPQHIPVPTRHFSHIHVDLVGPLPASKGFTYLFTIIVRTSRWSEAIPIAATTTVD